MQIWFLSNGSYSLKNCHNPQPYGKMPVEHLRSFHGSSLRAHHNYVIFPKVWPWSDYLEVAVTIAWYHPFLRQTCCFKRSNIMSPTSHRLRPETQVLILGRPRKFPSSPLMLTVWHREGSLSHFIFTLPSFCNLDWQIKPNYPKDDIANKSVRSDFCKELL